MKSSNYILTLCRYATATFLTLFLMGHNIKMANSGEDRSYETERLLLAEQIEQLLITRGVCQSLKDCRERKLFFVSPARKGLAIATYGVSDVDVLRQIDEDAIKLFYRTKTLSIEIEHFLFTKEEALKSFFKHGKPFVTIKLER